VAVEVSSLCLLVVSKIWWVVLLEFVPALQHPEAQL
jgi:hypothetical protein